MVEGVKAGSEGGEGGEEKEGDEGGPTGRGVVTCLQVLLLRMKTLLHRLSLSLAQCAVCLSVHSD